MSDSAALWDLYGGVLATGTPEFGNPSRDKWRLEFRELDSSGRQCVNGTDGVPLAVAHWGFEVELPLVEVAMDPAQNLLALLTV